MQHNQEGWGTHLPSYHLSHCGASLSPLSPSLCTFTSAAPARHFPPALPGEVGWPPGPCPSSSLKRLVRCPLDTCNTEAHVFKKPGPGDILWACRWLSFPCSHSTPQEGCKFGRSCIISRPTPSHVSPATSLSVTPSRWPHSLSPPHLSLLLPAAHPADLSGQSQDWHGHAWQWICRYPCMPTLLFVCVHTHTHTHKQVCVAPLLACSLGVWRPFPVHPRILDALVPELKSTCLSGPFWGCSQAPSAQDSDLPCEQGPQLHVAMCWFGIL